MGIMTRVTPGATIGSAQRVLIGVPLAPLGHMPEPTLRATMGSELSALPGVNKSGRVALRVMHGSPSQLWHVGSTLGHAFAVQTWGAENPASRMGYRVET